MTGRLLVVALVVAAAFLLVGVLERRRGSLAVGFAPGITVATGPDCRLCDQAVAALRAVAPDLHLRILDAADLGSDVVRSVPTVVVADHRGEVVLRRSGRAAIADSGKIAGEARRVLQ